MALSRYRFVKSIKSGEGLNSSKVSSSIFKGIETGQIPFTIHTVSGMERLDTISGRAYGSSEYWWVIAAANGIGWSMQVVPGTLLKIPSTLESVFGFVR